MTTDPGNCLPEKTPRRRERDGHTPLTEYAARAVVPVAAYRLARAFSGPHSRNTPGGIADSLPGLADTAGVYAFDLNTPTGFYRAVRTGYSCSACVLTLILTPGASSPADSSDNVASRGAVLWFSEFRIGRRRRRDNAQAFDD